MLKDFKKKVFSAVCKNTIKIALTFTVLVASLNPGFAMQKKLNDKESTDLNQLQKQNPKYYTPHGNNNVIGQNYFNTYSGQTTTPTNNNVIGQNYSSTYPTQTPPPLPPAPPPLHEPTNNNVIGQNYSSTNPAQTTTPPNPATLLQDLWMLSEELQKCGNNKFAIINWAQNNKDIIYQVINHSLITINMLNDEITNLNNTHKNKIDNLNQVINNLSEANNNLNKTIKDNNQNISENNIKYEQLLNKHESLRKEEDHLKRQLNDAITQKNKNNEEIQEKNYVLIREKEDLNNQILTFNAIIKEKIEFIKNQDTEIKELKNLNDNLTQEKTIFNKQITELNNNIDDLRKENFDLIDEKNRLMDENTYLTNKNFDLIDEKNRLMDENNQLMDGNTYLTNKLNGIGYSVYKPDLLGEEYDLDEEQNDSDNSDSSEDEEVLPLQPNLILHRNNPKLSIQDFDKLDLILHEDNDEIPAPAEYNERERQSEELQETYGKTPK